MNELKYFLGSGGQNNKWQQFLVKGRYLEKSRASETVRSLFLRKSLFERHPGNNFTTIKSYCGTCSQEYIIQPIRDNGANKWRLKKLGLTYAYTNFSY
jgi:hypothetical protein